MLDKRRSLISFPKVTKDHVSFFVLIIAEQTLSLRSKHYILLLVPSPLHDSVTYPFTQFQGTESQQRNTMMEFRHALSTLRHLY